MASLPSCEICGYQDHWLGDHLAEAHGLSVEQYHEANPEAPTASEDLVEALKRSSQHKRKSHPPKRLTVDFGGINVPVNKDVPEDACLPLPSCYRFPQYGKLASDIREAAISLARGRMVYVYGVPGSGKDAFFHAYSAMTRTPGMIFQVQPGADLQAWFFSRSFDRDGTSWEEGELLKALRDGYTCPNGRVVPYLILITDFDRATTEQAEAMRLIMDSIEGRVMGPAGKTYKVMPGTQIVMTANTAGGGDARGRMISANVIDGSIMDRMERKYQFHWMDWRDEGTIVKSKFPLLVEKCPGVFDQVGAATTALRRAIGNEDLFAEFSHRGLCSWLGHAEDIVYMNGGKPPRNLLKRSARAFLDGMPDDETRTAAKRLIDPHLKGGILETGDTSHIDDDALDERF